MYKNLFSCWWVSRSLCPSVHFLGIGVLLKFTYMLRSTCARKALSNSRYLPLIPKPRPQSSAMARQGGNKMRLISVMVQIQKRFRVLCGSKWRDLYDDVKRNQKARMILYTGKKILVHSTGKNCFHGLLCRPACQAR